MWPTRAPGTNRYMPSTMPSPARRMGTSVSFFPLTRRPAVRSSGVSTTASSGARSLGLLVLGGWLMSLAGVVFWEHRDTARPAAAIVVLGAAQYVGRPSPVLRARLDHAIDLWRRGLAPRMIFTGGFGDHDTTSEA